MPHRALSLIENLPDQSILQRIGNTPLIRIRINGVLPIRWRID